MVNRESILARKLGTEPVEVPEWGGSVIVRALNATEYLGVVQRIKDDSARAVYHMIVACTFDANGARIFKDEDAATLEADQPYSVIERLIEPILRLNPQKDTAAGNSATPPSDSSTASR